LAATVNGTYDDVNPLNNVSILGVSTAPTVVKFGGEPLDESSWDYSAAAAVLTITGLGPATDGGAYRSNWNITWLEERGGARPHLKLVTSDDLRMTSKQRPSFAFSVLIFAYVFVSFVLFLTICFRFK
jgi:hypothetical protein